MMTEGLRTGRAAGLRRGLRARRGWLAAIVALVLFAGAVPLVVDAIEGREAARASGRLNQHRDALLSSLAATEPLAFVVATDADLIDVAKGGSPDRLNARLAAMAARTGAEAIYLMDATGLTLAASNHDGPDSFVGRSYAFRPYFRTALDGGTGRHFAVGATTGRPGYFFAEPVRDGARIVGVLAVKVPLDALQAGWGDGAPVFVTDAAGVVILASDPSWRSRLARTPDPDVLAQAQAERRYGTVELRSLSGPERDGWRLPDATRGALHLMAGGLPHDWTLHYLADGRPVRLTLWTLAAVVAVLAAGALLLRQERRAGRVRSALGRSRQEERSLRDANARLAHEIDERRAAEARLEEAQAELRRAGRLAALGQLAASVGHELSQPIAALRGHMAADAIRGDDGTALRARLPALADRMEGIVRQLKSFGRPAEVTLARIDLSDRVEAALDLLAPNIEAEEAMIAWVPPTPPVRAMGDAGQVEQVLVNLIRNALDAVAGEDVRRVSVTANDEGEWAVVRVHDSGAGLGGRTLDEIAEPFETSRARSGGLGLGLAIATQILREHGGDLVGGDAEDGGAVFEMRLPRAEDDG